MGVKFLFSSKNLDLSGGPLILARRMGSCCPPHRLPLVFLTPFGKKATVPPPSSKNSPPWSPRLHRLANQGSGLFSFLSLHGTGCRGKESSVFDVGDLFALYWMDLYGAAPCFVFSGVGFENIFAAMLWTLANEGSQGEVVARRRYGWLTALFWM